MRRISIFLIFSLFIGLVNAATMPISFKQVDSGINKTTSEINIHSHCEESSLDSKAKASSQSQNRLIDHYCCSLFAVLPTEVVVNPASKDNAYLKPTLDQQISFIFHLIYKPPKSDFS